MNNLHGWLSALRLPTLPLASASILVAGAIAQQHQLFDVTIFVLSLSTALLLQVLSNLANDYGDGQRGVDDENRLGPPRAIQSGLITPIALKRAIMLALGLTVLSGLSLLIVALQKDVFSWAIFIVLGAFSIIAAITYTMGKIPYGYRALGDLAVYLFFGLVGVVGGFYLYGRSAHWLVLLPASSIGLLSAAVLNINNIRDVKNDSKHKKITVVVILGRARAFQYHLLLIFLAPLLSCLYLFQLQTTQSWQYIFLLVMIPLVKSSFAVKKAIDEDLPSGDNFNEQLKNTAMSTFVFSLLFSMVLIT